MRPSPDELRNLIFNAEMALCDLRGFASGGVSYVNEEVARDRAADLRTQAENIERLFGANHAPA